MELTGVGWQTIGLSSAELIKETKIKQISTTKCNPHQKTPQIAIDENQPKTNILQNVEDHKVKILMYKTDIQSTYHSGKWNPCFTIMI